MMSNDMDSDGDDEVLLTTKGGKYWPQMRILCTQHKTVALKILKAVDECKCTSELNANNSDNPKGNAWNRLYDHCFGGGTTGRGLLAGWLPVLPTASKLKLKVVDIWSYAKKESANVDNELVLTALRQEKEYEKVKADEKVAADKHKVDNEVLQEKMRTYEAGRGALPPGAKGTVGGGRRQHSTNLKTNQPSSYAYANATTGGENAVVVIDDKTPPKGKQGKNNKVSAATVNNNHMEFLTTMNQTFQKNMLDVLDKDKGTTPSGKKRKRLETKLGSLKKQISTYQGFPDDQLFMAMLEKTKREYITTADELNALGDSDGEN